MSRIFEFLQALKNWQRGGLAFLLGGVSALAMAPFHLSGVLFLTFPGFIALLDSMAGKTDAKKPEQKPSLRTAGWLGWCFGFGYFLAGLWWIGSAFLVQAELFAWALPFALAGLPAGLALFWAAASAGAALVWQGAVQKILAIAFSFTLAEFLRGTLFSGFPWNALGYAAMPTPMFMQSASLIGLWGVTLLLLLVVCTPGLIILEAKRVENGSKARFSRAGYGLMGFAALVCLAHASYGAIRLSKAGPIPPDLLENRPRLRLVQPNIPQREKWRPEKAASIFQSYLALSHHEDLEEVDLLIWPESAFPFLIQQNEAAFSQIKALLPSNTMLAAGGHWASLAPGYKQTPAQQKFYFYNTVLFFDHTAAIQHIYRKKHLVPFGEFMPFSRLWEQLGIMSLAQLPQGFRPGQNSNFTALTPEKLPPFSTLICYEIIFPTGFETSGAVKGERAKWLLNLTNDAWFGKLAGPYQHFQQARLRAVEQGLPLIRTANTGISAVIDGYGRILHILELEQSGVIDATLPPALPLTPFAKFKNLPFAAMMSIVAILLAYGARRALAKKPF